ncbi:Carboxylesterase 5A, partial [Halocaridina rubra]
MDSKVTWILLLILLSYCLAQDSNISSSGYEVTTSQGDRTIPTSEVNEDESTSGSLLNDNETLVLGTIEVEEWITSDNSSVTETSPQPTYSISTTEDPFPQGQGADDEINTVLATTNENTASKMKVIMSLWNEVINLAGNDSKTQEWTDIASSLWKDMLFQDWNELSVSKWNENMTLLWNEIMIYLEDLDDEPIDPSWNNTMVMLWNDFIGSHMTGLSTQSYFTDSDKGQSFSPNYIGIPAHPAWVPEYENTDWHSYPDYGIEHYPEWSQYGGTVYKDFNITSYTNGPPSLDDEAVEVVLIQGTILGRKERAKRGKSYFYSFKGIPYGEPPVGNLRFMDPIPAAPWNGTRDGTKDPQRCPQLQFYITVGEEDCLYLNVYTPMASEGNLPVMVWIHGGSFVTGGADEYPPLPFMSKNIVLVTIQYRLGTLGFLSTEDSIMPGNLGLKDQTLALQWVNKNIQALGGDPNKITIFGQGAGAASVHLHVISPKARGLFQRAIMQSGSALNQAVIRTDHKEVAMTVGKEYNCSAGDGELFNSTLLLQCLQTLPLKHIVAVPSLFTMIVSLPRVMTPRVDGDFLPDHPAHLLKQGTYNKVDVISGITEHEGAIVALPFLLNPWLVNELMGNFEVAGPALVSTEKEKEPVKLARDILDYYFHGHPVSIAMGDNFIQ